MATVKRSATTIYLDPGISRAIKVKAASSGRSVSALANESLRRLLSEDERDLRTFRRRRREPVRPYEEVLAELRRDGLL